MTTEAITESGMIFGPYAPGECFYIERSPHYQSIQEGVKMAEFLLLKRQDKDRPTMWIVEAKSSCPRDLDEYMAEIREKLINGFMLGVAACLDRHGVATEDLPQSFKELDISSACFLFVLVVKGVPEYHLEVLKSKLALELKPAMKTWSIPATSVAVLNEAYAHRYGLILQAPEN